MTESGEGLIRMSDKKAFSELMFTGRRLKTVINVFEKTNKFCEENGVSCDSDEFEHIMINQNKHLIREMAIGVAK